MTARWLATLIEGTMMILGLYLTWQAGGFY
jgi:hypothetical protein